MQKKLLIYNNTTGIADRIEPLLMGEKMEVLVAESAADLERKLQKKEIHLLLVDLELEDKGWD